MNELDEQEQAQAALKTMFRRDQAAAPARAARKPPWRYGPSALRWLIAAIAIMVILAPISFIVIYPRFGPVDTMTGFCRAESAGDYAKAYGLLSPRVQAQVSLATFTKTSDGVNMVDCNVDGGIPFIFGGTTSSLTVDYMMGSGGPYGSSVTGAMSFVKVNGAWRIDSMQPDFFNLGS